MPLTPESLRQMSEDQFRKEVLVPLFQAMGYLDVHLQHGGVLEQGKDIVMWKRDDIRDRVNFAVVAKSDPVSGKASGNSSAAEVVFQLQQCFGYPYQDAVTLEDQVVHRCIVACPHEIRKEAQRAVRSALDTKLVPNVDFLCGQRLWNLIEEHLGPRTALATLQKAGRLLEDATAHHRVVAHVRGADVVFGIEAKHPDAAAQEPLVFRGTFAFPNDEDGRRAMAAFESHIKTGSPVTLSSSYIKEWEVPSPLRPFFGTELEQISMLPAPSPRVIVGDLSLETLSGRSEIITGLRLRTKQAGTEEITVVSEEGEAPYTLAVTANRSTREVTLSISFDIGGVNVKRALEATRFRDALAEGGQIVFRDVATGLALTSGIVPPGLTTPASERFEEFLSALAFIQAKTKCLLNVPARDLEMGEVRATMGLASALRTGSTRGRANSVTVTLTREGVKILLSQASAVGQLAIANEETVRILDTDVPVGRVVRIVTGLEIPATDVSRLQQHLDVENPNGTEVTLVAKPDGGEATTVYLAHIPPEERRKYAQFLG